MDELVRSDARALHAERDEEDQNEGKKRRTNAPCECGENVL